MLAVWPSLDLVVAADFLERAVTHAKFLRNEVERKVKMLGKVFTRDLLPQRNALVELQGAVLG
eukprot:JP436967.1.p4 GENE.JP436967.1~~JP436967.1.p4  ORF type:complete len:63 (-),score=11.64 JP436967.1:32-220(-)